MLYGTIPKIQEHFKKHSRLRSLKKVRLFGFIPQPKEIGILGLTFVSLKTYCSDESKPGMELKE